MKWKTQATMMTNRTRGCLKIQFLKYPLFLLSENWIEKLEVIFSEFCQIFDSQEVKKEKNKKNITYSANFLVFSPCFRVILHIFFRLKAIANKAKAIVTLSIPKWRKRLYCIFCFICPNTASGSTHRLPLCLTPSSDISRSVTFRLYCLSRWFISIYYCPLKV